MLNLMGNPMPRLGPRSVAAISTYAFIFCAALSGTTYAEDSGAGQEIQSNPSSSETLVKHPAIRKAHKEVREKAHEASHEDESLLAKGFTLPFQRCVTHAQCRAGSVCVDNGGDHNFYCKPICNSDAECPKWRFPQIMCVRHLRADGTPFTHRVCNDAEWSHLM